MSSLRPALAWICCCSCAYLASAGGACTKSHSECPLDHYCARWHRNDNSHLCVHCVNCNNERRTWDPLGSSCPAKCRCTSHDQCGPKGYCSVYHPSGDEPIHVCQSCDMCKGNRRHTEAFDNGGECPAKCFCSGSSDCDEGEICSTRGDSGGRSVCIGCAHDNGGCVDAWAEGGESCDTICPGTYQCGTHDDCGVGTGRWCAMNHRCNDCNDGECWTDARINKDTELSNWRRIGLLEYQVPRISIDFACPASCCDWGMSQPETRNEGRAYETTFEIGPCDSNLHIDAYWIDGQRLDLTPAEFKGEANRCDVTRHDFESGFPRSVTMIDCSELVEKCKVVNKTVALLVSNRSINSAGLETFLNPGVYPFAAVHDWRHEDCGLDAMIRLFQLIGKIIAAWILINMLIACARCFVWLCRIWSRPDCDQYGSPLPSSSSSEIHGGARRPTKKNM